MDNIGDRIKSERRRLKLNQTDFAAIGGVKQNAQTNYENNKRSPNTAYWKGISEAGVDVNYVLTGRTTTDMAAMKGIGNAYQTGDPEQDKWNRKFQAINQFGTVMETWSGAKPLPSQAEPLFVFIAEANLTEASIKKLMELLETTRHEDFWDE